MNLRQAAEMALEALEGDSLPFQLGARAALRQALAQPEYQYEVVAVSENGIRTVKQTAIPKREWNCKHCGETNE
jgi:hypothetical protein